MGWTKTDMMGLSANELPSGHHAALLLFGVPITCGFTLLARLQRDFLKAQKRNKKSLGAPKPKKVFQIPVKHSISNKKAPIVASDKELPLSDLDILVILLPYKYGGCT
ncbi:hypothetical protein FRC02_005201 [Tulasnella sp. 418]|nr:hypothetical protein FRC02_005201 [Tulasnella sp. 418]